MPNEKQEKVDSNENMEEFYDIEIVWNVESIGSSERGFQASLGGCLSRSPPSTFALIDKSGYLRRALLKSFKSSEFHPGFTWISYNYYVNGVVASISTVNSTAFYLFWINVLDCKPVYGSFILQLITLKTILTYLG